MANPDIGALLKQLAAQSGELDAATKRLIKAESSAASKVGQVEALKAAIEAGPPPPKGPAPVDVQNWPPQPAWKQETAQDIVRLLEELESRFDGLGAILEQIRDQYQAPPEALPVVTAEAIRDAIVQIEWPAPVVNVAPPQVDVPPALVEVSIGEELQTLTRLNQDILAALELSLESGGTLDIGNIRRDENGDIAGLKITKQETMH